MIKRLVNIIILLIQFRDSSIFKHFLRFEENSLEKCILPILNLEGGDYRRNFAAAFRVTAKAETTQRNLERVRVLTPAISVTVAGVFVYLYMSRKVNIPIKLLLEVIRSRKDLELLALRVFMMLAYKNATMFNVSAEKISKSLWCDKPTSERLLFLAKRSPWFSFNSRRNSLRALTMKSQDKKYSDKGLEYRSDFCYRMDLDYISLNEMVKRLRGIVIMMIIVQATREQLIGAESGTESFILIYQTTFAKYLGLSNKSVCRLLQHLSSIGWVHKTKQYFYKLKDLKNASKDKIEEYEKANHNCHLAERVSSRYYGRTKSVDFNYYKCFGLGYSIDESFSKRFRNIMWTNERRVNSETQTPSSDKRTLVSIPEFYDLIFNPNFTAEYVQEHFRVA